MPEDSKLMGEKISNKERQGVRWGQERRLEFIDYRLRWDRQINRSNLTDFFGISIPQASLDLTEYTKLAPNNLEYDTRARVYRSTDSYKSIYQTSSLEHYLEDLMRMTIRPEIAYGSFLGWQPPVAGVPRLGRRLNPEVVGEILKAIREKGSVEVTYLSMNDLEGGQRKLTPHALVNDGNRWHVRAYCHKRKEFRDFTLTRIKNAQYVGLDQERASMDTEWNNIVSVILTPHPELSSARRCLIERDYSMENGEMLIECRQALLLYLLFQLNLTDDQATQRPEVIQLALKNRDEIYGLVY